jgi:hypothetical protein
MRSGELIYLGVEYDGEMYLKLDRKGVAWDPTCGGCHSATKGADTGLRAEPGIGCESCHGPGSEHILGKGDPAKIFNSTDPNQSCAACHSGYNGKKDASRFPIGYRPGMNLADTGFVTTPAEPDKAPQAMHHKGAVPQWQASAHAGAAITLNEGSHSQ